MAADIVNLKRFRKARAKSAERTIADENRRKHGEKRTDREVRAANAALDSRKLENAQRTACDKIASSKVATDREVSAYDHRPFNEDIDDSGNAP